VVTSFDDHNEPRNARTAMEKFRTNYIFEKERYNTESQKDLKELSEKPTGIDDSDDSIEYIEDTTPGPGYYNLDKKP